MYLIQKNFFDLQILIFLRLYGRLYILILCGQPCIKQLLVGGLRGGEDIRSLYRLCKRIRMITFTQDQRQICLKMKHLLISLRSVLITYPHDLRVATEDIKIRCYRSALFLKLQISAVSKVLTSRRFRSEEFRRGKV